MHNITTLSIAALLTCIALQQPASAADWNQWMGGPARTNSADLTAGTELKLKERWRKKIATAYSAPAIRGKNLVAHIASEPKDAVVLIDMRTGKEKWRVDTNEAWKTQENVLDGPLATPAIDDTHAYALTPQGKLYAVDLESGAVKWVFDLEERAAATMPNFGFATSPLLVDDLVIIQPGGRNKTFAPNLVALTAKTGDVKWQAFTGDMQYASPTLIEIKGEKQIVAKTQSQLFAVDVAKGQQRWAMPLEGVSPNTPSVAGPGRLLVPNREETLLVSVGGDLPGTPKIEATTEYLSGGLAPVAIAGDTAYGNYMNKLTALDLKSGKLKWASELDAIPLIAGDYLFALETKTGKLHVGRDIMGSFTVQSEMQAFEGADAATYDCNLAFADGALIIRTPKELVVLDVTAR